MSSVVNIELNTDYQSAQRFPVWIGLMVFSIICLISVTTTLKHRDSADKWVLSVTVISMLLSFFAVVAYLAARSLFVGQFPESAILGVLTLFWAAGMPVIMSPSRQIAVVNQSGEGLVIIDANLYFFSWLSLACVLYLTGSLAQETAGIDVTATSRKTASWYGLCASSIVVMAAASEALHDSKDCHVENLSGSHYCRRSRTAIGIGVVSALLAGAVTYLLQQNILQLRPELMATAVLVVMWSFGVGYITFGTSPGSTISNLYFASWISFILAVFLFAQNFREVLGGRHLETTNQQQQQDHNQNAVGSNPVVNIEADM